MINENSDLQELLEKLLGCTGQPAESSCARPQERRMPALRHLSFSNNPKPDIQDNQGLNKRWRGLKSPTVKVLLVCPQAFYWEGNTCCMLHDLSASLLISCQGLSAWAVLFLVSETNALRLRP